MKTFPDLATEFIEELHHRNEESQTEIDRIESMGIRVGERHAGGPWSDVTDREIALLKQDISSRKRTIARLEQALAGNDPSAPANP
jgi:hypothetical protein